VAVHPSEKNDVHELYLMCDDVKAFIAEMKRHKVATSPVQNQGWGLVTHVTLPGGGKLGVYQPRHARPEAVAAPAAPPRAAAKKTAAKRATAKKAATKAAAKPAPEAASKKTAAKKTAKH
jgi:hypothetical protein